MLLRTIKYKFTAKLRNYLKIFFYFRVEILLLKIELKSLERNDKYYLLTSVNVDAVDVNQSLTYFIRILSLQPL